MDAPRQAVEINFGHTPDTDDAFMLYALTVGKVSSPALTFRHIIKPIQQLNEDAKNALHELSALSLAAYPYVCSNYDLLPAGVCMGFNYGPMLLSNRQLNRDELSTAKIAIPGRMTTAYLTLRLFQPNLNVVEMPFDKIPQAIVDGTVDAGLVIHEAQLTHRKLGLTKVVDLGEWWHQETGLPLPLGVNVISNKLPEDIVAQVARVYQASIKYALANKEEALEYSLQYARGMEKAEAAKFITMYVNESTVDYGKLGMAAVEKLFQLASDNGLLEQKFTPKFVGLAGSTK